MTLKDVITEKIGNGIELMIEGLPQAALTPALQAKTALSLVKYGIPSAGVIGVGILGGVKTAALNIGGQVYQIKYCIKVLKVMTALQIYSEAIDWIEYQKQKGGFDAELADQAKDYLRGEFDREFPK